MILVTVGTQLTFDRLIRAVESWAQAQGRTDLVFQTGKGGYKPSIGKVCEFIGPVELDRMISEAELVIGHAGIGTIISRLSLSKPIVVMPRLYALGEHRNDHQKATVAHMRHMPGVVVADDEQALAEAINTARGLADRIEFPCEAQQQLTDYIRQRVL